MGASGNMRRVWDRGEFAICLFFPRKDLVEVLGISGGFIFSFALKKIRGRHLYNICSNS